MKCGQLKKGDLALAYMRAAEDANGAEVDMNVLAPHLKATGSSCGACPALLVMAKKAFEAQNAENSETTMDVVRGAVQEVVPDLTSLIPKGA